MLPELRNVGIDGDRSTTLNSALANADVTATIPVFGKSAGMFAPRLALGNPLLRALPAQVDKRARDHGL